VTQAIVLTTINAPTRAIRALAERCGGLGTRFIVIGDRKTPQGFSYDGLDYFDVDAQLETGLALAGLAPLNHYARKNIGYLLATRSGAGTITETDDDNVPLEGFWRPRTREVSAPTIDAGRWSNVYAYFTDQHIWPRGLPLNHIRLPQPPLSSLRIEQADCPIQQGLADGDPDVDAIYRLVLPLPINFLHDRQVVLKEGVWCPFNSQNTTFFKDAFPLMYLPAYCSWRVTDIWRSFVAQRVGWGCGWRLSFHSPTVFQERNEHDLMRDFVEEIPGYVHNEAIVAGLTQLPLQGGVENIPDDLVACYEMLIGMGLVDERERSLVRAWLQDLGV
jgi:hypothetical protein